MKKELITSQQATFLVIIFILGTSLILTGGGKADQDVWISISLAILATLPMVFIYGKILSTFPGKNLYEILEISFGKIIGKIISALYILYFIYLGSLSLRNITEFVQISSFPRTPQIFSAICISLLSIYMVRSGIEVLGKWAKLTTVFIFFLIAFITLTSFRRLSFENLRPILYKGWQPILYSSFTLMTFPFGEIVIFLTLFHTLKDHEKSTRIFVLGLIIGGLIILITALRNMFLLGFPILSKIHFPTYYANTLISLGAFLQRIELVSAIALLLSGFAKVSICLFAASIGFKELFNRQNYNNFSIPLVFVMTIISIFIYKSAMEMFEGIQIYKYIALPFQMIFPPIILFFGWRKKKSQGNNP